MKKEITRLICATICCAPIIGFAQTGDKFTSADNLYKAVSYTHLTLPTKA